jgi:hypothetical protein
MTTPMFRIARLILTLELVLGVFLSFLLDWSPNHLLNPDWHPHARFPGGLLLFFVAGVSGVALWLLWRRSLEPQVAIDAAALLTGAFWTPLYYLSTLIPGSSAWAGRPGGEPHVGSVELLPNLVVALIFVAAAFTAYKISRLPAPPETRLGARSSRR